MGSTHAHPQDTPPADGLRERIAEAARREIYERAALYWIPANTSWDRDKVNGMAERWADMAAPGLADAVLAVRDEELKALRALVAECSCGTTYATYEGPEPDCPVHGAVRGLNDATRKLAEIAELVRPDPVQHESAYDLAKDVRRILDREANGG